MDVKHSSGAVWESRWPSWAVRPNEPSGFRGRKVILIHASAEISSAWCVDGIMDKRISATAPVVFQS